MTAHSMTTYDPLSSYMAEIRRYPLLTKEEEYELARRWHSDGDVSAAHRLVTSNLRFVVKIANEYKGYGARMLDLIQEGSVGLMQAVKRFDPDKGYRLISYAVYWIRSYIHAFIMGTWRIFKLGTARAHRALFFKLRSLKGKMAASGISSEEDLKEAVAEETGVDIGDVHEMDMYMTRRDSSLDAPVREGGSSLGDLMPAVEDSQEEVLADLEVNADLHARLQTAIESLDEREQRVLQARFFMDPPLMLKEIGDEMGVSKQRVKQLEKRAMDKLRNQLGQDAAGLLAA